MSSAPTSVEHSSVPLLLGMASFQESPPLSNKQRDGESAFGRSPYFITRKAKDGKASS